MTDNAHGTAPPTGTTGGGIALTEEQALELMAFLVSAAEICIHEPTYYGTFRLIDGAYRMMGMMLEHDVPQTREFIERFRPVVEQKRLWMMWDREAYYDFLRWAPSQVAAEVRRMHGLADDAAATAVVEGSAE